MSGGSYGMTGGGLISLPGPASPRNKASAAAAAACRESESLAEAAGYPRYSSDEGYDGPRSLPYSLQQYDFQDGTVYQVAML